MSNATRLSERSTHPHHIMVAPLDVGIRIGHEQIDNLVRGGTAIVDVADEMSPTQVIAPAIEQIGEGIEFAVNVREVEYAIALRIAVCHDELLGSSLSMYRSIVLFEKR